MNRETTSKVHKGQQGANPKMRMLVYRERSYPARKVQGRDGSYTVAADSLVPELLDGIRSLDPAAFKLDEEIACYCSDSILQTAGYHPLYGGGNSSGDTPKSNDMIQSMLTKESPEIIRFFRNIESLSEILDTQAEKMRPVLNGERYMTDSELAGHLKLTRRTLAEYRITGKLPYYKVGGKLLYKEKDILVLLERNRMEAFDYR